MSLAAAAATTKTSANNATMHRHFVVGVCSIVYFFAIWIFSIRLSFHCLDTIVNRLFRRWSKTPENILFYRKTRIKIGRGAHVAIHKNLLSPTLNGHTMAHNDRGKKKNEKWGRQTKFFNNRYSDFPHHSSLAYHRKMQMCVVIFISLLLFLFGILFVRSTNVYPYRYTAIYHITITTMRPKFSGRALNLFFFHFLLCGSSGSFISSFISYEFMNRFFGMQEIRAILFYWRQNGSLSVVIILCGIDLNLFMTTQHIQTEWKLIGLDGIVAQT